MVLVLRCPEYLKIFIVKGDGTMMSERAVKYSIVLRRHLNSMELSFYTEVQLFSLQRYIIYMPGTALPTPNPTQSCLKPTL